jgi:glycosyltransferase involved in cell wall biosynthesis
MAAHPGEHVNQSASREGVPEGGAAAHGVAPRPPAVSVVGSGTRFLSGISVYTIHLANALVGRHRVSIVTMRGLLPRRLYPGRDRVGQDLAAVRPAPGIDRFDGINWYWLPSLPRGLWFLARRKPDVLVLQWWTGTVLHTYLALALAARLTGRKVVVEFHEVLDTGEARMGLARTYVRLVAPLVIGLASAFAVHSTHDRDAVRTTYRVGRRRPLEVLPHGPYDHASKAATTPPLRDAPAGVTNLLFFGIIRPYKGLEDLVRAFDSLEPDEAERYWLTVVGETWEGWTLPADLIRDSRHLSRITFVNRYVHDAELDGYLRGADAVVLPYHRSSLSGPLHVAMGYGMPIVITDVGGNPEGAAGYGGLVVVPPQDVDGLRTAILGLADRTGERYAHPHSWTQTADAYDALFAKLGFTAEAPGAAGPGALP